MKYPHRNTGIAHKAAVATCHCPDLKAGRFYAQPAFFIFGIHCSGHLRAQTNQSFISRYNTMNIYVGNLAWKTRQNELKELFENFGEVTNAFIVRDKVTRRSRGFGFVEMADEKEARQAIEKLNNTVFLDRTITVNEALPKEDESTAGDSANTSDEKEADEPAEQQETSDEETRETGKND